MLSGFVVLLMKRWKIIKVWREEGGSINVYCKRKKGVVVIVIGCFIVCVCCIFCLYINIYICILRGLVELYIVTKIFIV